MTLEAPRGVDESSGRITTDHLPYDFIGGLQQRFTDRIFDPLSDPTATDRLVAQHHRWQDMGHTTVFSSGFYDLFHPDHAGYILHTKAAAARLRYEQTIGGEWDRLDPSDQQAYIIETLSAGTINLVTSVASDANALATKSGKTEKGGAIRPVLSWNTRALMVAGQAFVDPLDPRGERLLRTTDAVTMHSGNDAGDFPADNPHASHIQLAALLQPDAWVFFGESKQIIDAAPHHEELASIALFCISDGDGTHYFSDDIIGKVSTTKITQRILGEPAR
jgi:hypothetical protein